MLSWLEALIVAAAALAVLRVLLKRPVRREFATHPILMTAALIAGGALVAGLGWIALRSDVARHVMAAVLGVALLAAWWRARPGYGARRGLPPGSLGLGASLDMVDDPTFYLRAAERWGPIFKTAQIHQPVICIADSRLGHELLERRTDALVQVEWPFNRLFPGGYVEFMNGELHDRYRAILAPALSAAVLEDTRKTMESAVARGLDEMVHLAAHGPIDPEPLLYPMTFPILIRAILGVSIDDPRGATLREIFTELNRFFELFLPTPSRMSAAYQRAADLIGVLARERIAAGPAGPGERSMLSELLADDPDRLSDPTVVGNLVLMVKDGSTIVRGQLRWVLNAIADDPTWADRQVERSAAGDDAAVEAHAASLVHETLRASGVQYVYRRLATDLEVAGYRLPRGWLVRFCYEQAHGNPSRYPDPERFDPDRFVDGLPEPADYCPFGHGAHACIAADLTMAVATTLARQLASGYRIRTVAGGPPWRINRHWGIWRPSAALRVAIAARTSAGVAGSSSTQTPQAS